MRPFLPSQVKSNIISTYSAIDAWYPPLHRSTKSSINAEGLIDDNIDKKSSSSTVVVVAVGLAHCEIPEVKECVEKKPVQHRCVRVCVFRGVRSILYLEGHSRSHIWVTLMIRFFVDLSFALPV